MKIIIKIIILLILLLNILVIYLIGKFNFLQIDEYKYYLLLFLVLIEWTILLIIIKKFYEFPIENIVYNIKNFLIGGLKDDEITIQKTINNDVNYLASFFKRTLSTLKSIKSDFIHGKEIKSEVELGKEIQLKFLEKKQIEVPSIDVIAKSKPAGEIGGDSFDIINRGDNYYIYVGDATGHGVGAGFIMMMVNALISGFSEVFTKGSDILINTNKILKPRVKANLLMSLLLLTWNEKEKRLFMTGAGHEYLIIYKNSTKKCYKIKSNGIALGMTKDISKIVKDKEIKFELNDIIILYSDGITESINKPTKDGTEARFGEERLMQAINEAPNEDMENYKSVSSVFNNITIELSKFMGYKYTQLDDITLVVMHYRDNSGLSVARQKKEISKEFITDWNW